MPKTAKPKIAKTTKDGEPFEYEAVDPSIDHYCGDHVDAGKCVVCGGPDPR